MSNVTTLTSCTSKCRIETLQGKKVTDATLESFQGCVDQCRFTRTTNALLNDIRGMAQAASSLFTCWAETAATCAPIVEGSVHACNRNLASLMRRYVMDTAWSHTTPQRYGEYCASIANSYSEGMLGVISARDICGGK